MGFLRSIFSRQAAEPAPVKGKRAARQQAGDHAETVQRLRIQARRRLIGAAVLVGIGIVAFPLVFETQPRPVPMDLPIVIPSRDQPAQGKGPSAVAALPAALPEEARVQEPADSEAGASAPPTGDPLPLPDATASAALATNVPAAGKAATARFVVQVGAFADKKAAQDARQRLERKGLKTYAQVAQTKDGERIRVRLGPFAERGEAEKAVAAAKAAGLDGKLLTL